MKRRLAKNWRDKKSAQEVRCGCVFRMEGSDDVIVIRPCREIKTRQQVVKIAQRLRNYERKRHQEPPFPWKAVDDDEKFFWIKEAIFLHLELGVVADLV